MQSTKFIGQLVRGETYTLTETDIPVRYHKIPDRIIFQISDNGTRIELLKEEYSQFAEIQSITLMV